MSVWEQDPALRPSAQELLEDEFVRDAPLPDLLKQRVAQHFAQQKPVRPADMIETAKRIYPNTSQKHESVVDAQLWQWSLQSLGWALHDTLMFNKQTCL